MLGTIFVFLAWKTRRTGQLISVVISLASGKKTIAELVQGLSSPAKWYYRKKSIVFESSVAVSDCTELKMNLLGELRECRDQRKSLTISFVHVREITSKAIKAFEAITHQITAGKFTDIIVKVIFPIEGECQKLDLFRGWAEQKINDTGCKNLTLKTDIGVSYKEKNGG